MSQKNITPLIFAVCATVAGASIVPASVFAAEGDTPAVSSETARVTVPPKTAADLDSLETEISSYPGFSTVHSMILSIELVADPRPDGTNYISNASSMIEAFAAEGDKTDHSAWKTMPWYEVIQAMKETDLYKTNDTIKSMVDEAYRNLTLDLPPIIAGLEYLFPGESIDYSQMSAGELVAKARTYPGFDKYEALVVVFGELVTATGVNAPAMTDEERGVLYDRAYQALVAAFPTIGDDILPSSADTSKKSAPAAPNTGSTHDSELSATIVTVALTAIIGLATISGAVVIAKNYFFSPLKRRK